MNLLKKIFFSIYTFSIFFLLIIASLMIIQHKYYYIMLEEYNLKYLKDTVESLFFSSFFLTSFYLCVFYLKIKEYVKSLKSYMKPFEFISITVSIMFTLGTILWNYKFIKLNEKLELIAFRGYPINIDVSMVNLLNTYFNLFIFFSAFLLLVITFLLLLNFNIEDYKNKNRLYKEYVLTKKGWFEGSYKLSNDLHEVKIIEPNKLLLIVRAYVDFNNYKLYAERFFFNTELPKSDYYIEEIELIKKHFDNEKISSYLKKYTNYSFEQDNIKNIEILKKFKI